MTNNEEEQERQERIAEALGSTRVVPLEGLPAQGPLDLLAIRDLVSRRFESTGGRPTDPAWTMTRQVPFNPEVWQQLQDLSEIVGQQGGRRLAPAQLAAYLIESGLKRIEANDEGNEAPDDIAASESTWHSN